MAKQKTETLFEESSQGAVGAITGVLFVLSVVLMLGGFILMAYGIQPSLGAAELWTFCGGLAATIVGFIIPFAILPATGK
ncbi:hypothetical protein G7066_09935 [Leucobacter coleopterorum]|uniref:Uncharacterized protein n=1 Tax=Leucobacter coleopterorum TaxID=2714933 RepID=A0ABX6K0R2_9MICO|nr:hypothetical protein [Leucobacter coleopterorum]QIM18832.1 hypothetical protein G7066_09935 [Leucobacter coleopterorum]